MGSDRRLRRRIRLNKKASNIVMENTVKAILFLLLFVVVLVILRNWWVAYHSQGPNPAIKSLNNLQNAVERLDPEYPDITRTVAVQTDNYIIKGYTSNAELCGQSGADGLNCLCVCESERCDLAYKNSKRYCRVIEYRVTNIVIDNPDSGDEKIANYEISLTGSSQSPDLNIVPVS